MKRLLFLTILVKSVLGSTWAQTVPMEPGDDNMQFVSWGITAAPNLVGYRFNLEDSFDNPDHIHPALGLDAGAFFEYHVTPRWSLQLTAAGEMERLKLIKNDTANRLLTIGLDVEVLACMRQWGDKGAWFAKLGPFTHFVLYNQLAEDGNISNPYTRIIANDPRTGEPRFAMNDFNAGISLSVGFETMKHWQYAINLKWSVSDLLNQDSHENYIKPYHIALQISYHFL